MWPLMMLFALAAGAGGLGRLASASDRTRKATEPGGTGMVPFGRENTAFGDQYAPDQQTRDFMLEYQHVVPGGSLDIAGEEANQDALRRQSVYADRNIANIESGPWRDTLNRLHDLGAQGEQSSPGMQWSDAQFAQQGGPKAVTTQTIDQIAAQMMDQNNAQAVTANKMAEESAARTGQALGPYQQEIAAQNTQANARAMRDAQIQASLSNADYAAQMANSNATMHEQARQALANLLLGTSQADAGYTESLNAANIDRASLEQPVNWGKLADMYRGVHYTDLGLNNANDQAMANALLSLAGQGFGLGEAARQAHLARAAASGGGGMSSMFGSLGGAGGGAAIGAMLAPATGGASLALPVLLGAGVGSGVGGSIGGAFDRGGAFSPGMVSNPLMGAAAMYGASNPSAINAAPTLRMPPISTYYNPNSVAGFNTWNPSTLNAYGGVGFNPWTVYGPYNPYASSF